MGTAKSNLKEGDFIIVKHCFKANKNDCTVFHIDESSAERVVIIGMNKENLTFSKRLGFLITDEKETVSLENVLNKLPQLKTLGGTIWSQRKFVIENFDFSRWNLLKTEQYTFNCTLLQLDLSFGD